MTPCRAGCHRETYERNCAFCTVCLGKLGEPNRLRLASAVNALRTHGSPETQAHYATVLQECVTHLQEGR